MIQLSLLHLSYSIVKCLAEIWCYKSVGTSWLTVQLGGGRKWRYVSRLHYLRHCVYPSIHLRYTGSGAHYCPSHRYHYILHVLIAATLFFSCLLTPTRPDRDGRQWRCCQSQITAWRSWVEAEMKLLLLWTSRHIKHLGQHDAERWFCEKWGTITTGTKVFSGQIRMVLHESSPSSRKVQSLTRPQPSMMSFLWTHCSVDSSLLCPPHSTTPW